MWACLSHVKGCLSGLRYYHYSTPWPMCPVFLLAPYQPNSAPSRGKRRPLHKGVKGGGGQKQSCLGGGAARSDNVKPCLHTNYRHKSVSLELFSDSFLPHLGIERTLLNTYLLTHLVAVWRKLCLEGYLYVCLACNWSSLRLFWCLSLKDLSYPWVFLCRPDCSVRCQFGLCLTLAVGVRWIGELSQYPFR